MVGTQSSGPRSHDPILPQTRAQSQYTIGIDPTHNRAKQFEPTTTSLNSPYDAPSPQIHKNTGTYSRIACTPLQQTLSAHPLAHVAHWQCPIPRSHEQHCQYIQSPQHTRHTTSAHAGCKQQHTPPHMACISLSKPTNWPTDKSHPPPPHTHTHHRHTPVTVLNVSTYHSQHGAANPRLEPRQLPLPTDRSLL
jgi:hypothetical protein